VKGATLENLRRIAAARGVQPEFIDSAGIRREASPETLSAMLELLGGEEIHKLPPVIVCWDGKPRSVEWSGSVRSALLTSAEGEEKRQAIAVFQKRGAFTLPSLAFGYYDLTVKSGKRQYRSLVISAPTKAYAPRGLRAFGVFVPMYALRSKRSWGAGDFTGWRQFCDVITRRSSAEMAAATLPLLGAFIDKWKCEPSPYSPATRLFWNEFYLDVARVPEFAASRSAQRKFHSARFQQQLAMLRQSGYVDYAKEMRLKRELLERLCQEFFDSGSPRRGEFESFLKRSPDLLCYAAFRAACEKRRESWQHWPERMRQGALRNGDYDAQVQRYFMFVQWLAQGQMDDLLAHCRERAVRFCLDLPLGVNPDGYDVWANQDLFVHGASVGAPPDSFFTKGQDWRFPPLHPARLRQHGYRYFINYISFQMRHTGLLRIDHVMGLHRLWWVPRGASASDGAYVRYNAEDLYAILCLESHRHKTMLVGENLGTVPPEVNQSMKRHCFRGMYVAQYEERDDSRAALSDPPRECVASLNTHDMPMWAAHWRGLDIADRQDLGLLTAQQAREERRRRARRRKALETFLRRRKVLNGPATARSVFQAIVAFLSKSKAEIVMVNLEDLWLETRPQNTPGTSTERINWRRKASHTLEYVRKTSERTSDQGRKPRAARRVVFRLVGLAPSPAIDATTGAAPS
jgi:4-alpha-glucanotransferase